jgi:hypothetical protein
VTPSNDTLNISETSICVMFKEPGARRSRFQKGASANGAALMAERLDPVLSLPVRYP